MDGIHEITFQMSLVRLVVILVTYYGIQYLTWPLTFLLVVVIFCFYVYLDDQLLAQPQTNEEYWQEEQIRMDRLIENWFGMKLEDFKLDWMNENDEESRRQKCKWLNELIKATWLECQDLVKDLIETLFEDINDNISDRTFFKVRQIHIIFVLSFFCIRRFLECCHRLCFSRLKNFVEIFVFPIPWIF